MRLNRHCPRNEGFTLMIVNLMALMVFLVWAGSTEAQVIYSDGTFNSEDWSLTIEVTSGNGGSGSGSQMVSGGSPGLYRSVTHTMGSRPAQLALFHRHLGSSFNPATQGSITEINFQVDIKTFQDSGYGGQSAAPVIRQDGIVFVGPFFSSSLSSWVHISRANLVAADFTPVAGIFMPPPGTDHPNFSIDGSTMDFGFLSSNSNPIDGIIGPSSTTVGYDNWSVAITVDVSGVEDNAGAGFGLNPSFPNPFESATRIDFELGRPGDVSIRVFDILGRVVRLFSLPGRPQGVGSIVWDGRDDAGVRVSSGIYLYQLETESFSATQRMMLLRQR